MGGMNELSHVKALESFMALLPEKGVVLEVNPGQGQYTRIFAAKGYKVLAAETGSAAALPVPYAADICRGQLNDLLISYRSLAGIWAPRILSEELRDEAALSLKHFCDWIHPTGIIAFSVLEGEGEKIIRPVMNGMPEKRLVYYHPEEISGMVGDAGLEVIDAWRELINEQPSLQVICRAT